MITAIQFNKQINPHLSALNESAYNFTKDTDRANDLLQDTLLRAISFYHRFEDGTNLRGWLFTIMRNTFINSFHRENVKMALVGKTENISPGELVYSAKNNGGEHRFLRTEIKKALSSLPSYLRLSFTLYVEGYRYHEIAGQLDCPIGTIKTRIHKARKILKTRLAEYRYGI
jgi:RNA polymerase sigma factor (sigma-70 family)